MAWIDIIDEASAKGKLAESYQRIGGDRGKVSNIMRVHSLKPASMDAHMDLYLALMFRKSGLSREEREVVATAVSVLNKCPYCVSHHAEALRAYWSDNERVDAFVSDPTGVDGLGVRQRALVDYAVKLTVSPASVEDGSVQVLRDIGLSDEEILNLNLVTSYFNFVNRIALGLGVQFSPAEVAGYEY